MKKFIIPLLAGLLFTSGATADEVTDCTSRMFTKIALDCEQNCLSHGKHGAYVKRCTRTLSAPNNVLTATYYAGTGCQK